MEKKSIRIFIIFMMTFLMAVMGLVACGSKPADTQAAPNVATATFTPSEDRCAAANVPNEVAKITRLMARFDDISVLAQAAPKEQLAVVILELNKITYDTEDLEAPACVQQLQKYGVDFMRTVSAVMTNFIGGATGQSLQQQIVFSRTLRTSYEVELGKLLGYEYHTPTPWPTPTATQVTPTSTPAPVTAITSKDVDVYQGPGTNYPKIGVLLNGQQANVIGRSEDFNWVLIEMWDSPDHKGWVAFPDVTINASLIMVPVATAIPSIPQ